ncbi:MAG: phage tail protein [Kofleriaceae bacterium]
MPTNLRNDPLPVFSFMVDLGMDGQALFKSVSGLRYETEVVPVRAGGVNDTTYNLVGATKWTNLVFKQGFTKSSALIDWRQKWMQGTMARIGGTITQLDTALQPQARWTFTRGWPCKWDIAEFDASKSELAIETLELAHDGLTYVALPAGAK